MSGASGGDLFEPTLQDARVGREPPAARPWRLGSQLYVAFFGGAPAATAIAWLNAGRLGLAPGPRQAILALGILVSLAVAGGVALYMGGRDFSEFAADRAISRTTRLVGRLAAVALFGVFYWMQRQADRLYQYNQGGEDSEIYASLWVPGTVAVLVGGVAQSGLVIAAWALL